MPRALYRIVSFDRQMPGAAAGWEASIRAIAKCNSASVPYCIANELICSEVGRFLRLPLPPAGVLDAPAAPERCWFASLDFNLTGNSLPPVDTARCVAELPNLSTGLIIFDILIGNADRHPSNFSVDFGAKPPEMNIFDHSHALFGTQAGAGKNRLMTDRDTLAAPGHCLIPILATDTHIKDWVERVEALPDFLIEDVTEQARSYGITSEEASEAAQFLKHRRDTMGEIIERNRAEFRNVKDWSLL